MAIFLSAAILFYHFIFRSGLDVSLDIIRTIMFVVISWTVAILSERMDKNKEAEIKQLALNKLILESAGEGIFGLDLEGNYIFVNPVAAKMLGYEVDELIGIHSHSSLHHTKKTAVHIPRKSVRSMQPMLMGIFIGKMTRYSGERMSQVSPYLTVVLQF